MVGIDTELTGSASFRAPTNAWSLTTQYSLVTILLSSRLLLPMPVTLSLSVSQSLAAAAVR